MSVDQPTEDVLRASAVVERARAQLADAMKAEAAAVDRRRMATQHLEGALSVLAEVVRAKALSDVQRARGTDSVEAFRLRYPEKANLIEATVRGVAHQAYAAGQAAAVARFTQGSHGVSAALRAISDGGVDVQILFNAHSKGVPVSVQVRELFRHNPSLSFNATDVQRLLDLSADKESVVRQNLRRLTEAEFITREERGLYRLNPVPHAPPPAEED